MDKQQKTLVAQFIKFVISKLGITSSYKVQLTSTRTSEFKTYAYYSPSEGIIKVYVAGRGLADCLRSIAHELVHHKQNQKDEIGEDVPDIGGEIEDEANAVAGQLIKEFGYQHPEVFNLSFSPE